MTDRQIQAAKIALNKKYYGNNSYIPDNLLQEWSEEDMLLDEELSCRKMINSILIYGGSCNEDSYQYKKYLLPYIKGNNFRKHLLTKERVAQLIKEQEEDITKATIFTNVYTDDEGVSYNSIIWEDDKAFWR